MISELKNKVTELAARTSDQLQQQLEDSRGKVQDQFSKLTTLGEDAREKLVEYANQLIDLLPVIEQCGYKTSGLKIDIGLPPAITFLCHNFKDITEEERQAILDANQSKELLAPIVKALVSADALQAKLHKGNLRLNVIEMTLGIPPSIVLELVPKQ
jgi:hypothetical protein